MTSDGSKKVRCSLWIAAFFAAFASASASADGADLAKLSWLGGCWQSVGAESGSGELWTMPAGGAMLGIGRTIKQGKMMTYEFLQIRTLENGALAYVAQSSGQNTAAFPVLQLTDNEVVFQNLEHDFPQRIIYRLEGTTKLAARIEGAQKGTLRAIDFPMERVSCEAPIN
jgi:hypothetical protein